MSGHDGGSHGCQPAAGGAGPSAHQEGKHGGGQRLRAAAPLLPLGHGDDPHGQRLHGGGQHRARLRPVQPIHHVRVLPRFKYSLCPSLQSLESQVNALHLSSWDEMYIKVSTGFYILRSSQNAVNPSLL